MSHKFIKPLVINLILLISIFSLFIFFDVNYSKASDTKIKQTGQTVAKTNLKPPYNYKNTPVFQWSPSHYKNLNFLNNATDTVKVEIRSNIFKNITFYSYRRAYYRFEIVHLILKGLNAQKCFVTIQRNKKIIPSFKGRKKLRFRQWNGKTSVSWFEGWSPATGTYTAVLWYNNKAIATTAFKIISRKPVHFNRSFSLINLEFPSISRNVRNPFFKKTPMIDAINQWMNYGDIDGLLMLSGETAGQDRVSINRPWSRAHLKSLSEVGPSVHNNGKLFGAYIMCFYTPQNGWKKAGYQSALGVGVTTNGYAYARKSKFTSFTDPKRFSDIVALARSFNKLPYVDLIGFDFIRFGEKVGYENADEFTRDMNISRPKYWKRYKLSQKVVWMGKIMRRRIIREKWRLWKAHKTAQYINAVIQTAGLTKPVWIFTLGWNHGEDHGQDPAFFQDAGVLADFVMLYEASPSMFAGMKKQWTSYLKKEFINYIPGNQIDAVVNHSANGRNPVDKFYWRLMTGVNYAPYFSRGVFIHDFYRAFFSNRRAGHSYIEWLWAGLSAVSMTRYLKKEIPFKITIPRAFFNYKTTSKTVVIPYRVSFRPETLSNLQGQTLTIHGLGNSFVKKLDMSGKTNVTLYVRINPRLKGARYFAIKAEIQGYPSFFTYRYLTFKKNNSIQTTENK